MGVTEEYKMSMYQDYGPLGEKQHIHLVRDIRNGRLCIKKVLNRMQESIVVYRKNYPNAYFPDVYDYFVINDTLVVIEEYIEGVTLEEYMMGNALEEEKALEIANQICYALQYLHHTKPMIVYRDLKPQNIMITKEERIKLIDFDISREVTEGKKRDTFLLGTAEYAAPEQFGYYQTDNRTDIYAFGVLFNYMLTGKVPSAFVTEGMYQGLVQKCTELDPAKRYQTIEEVLHVLGKPRSTRKKSTPVTESWLPPGFRSGNRIHITLAILGYLSIIIGTFSITENDNPFILWNERVWMIVCQLVSILINHNYRGITNYSKLWNSKYGFIRVLSYILTWCVCFIVGFVCCVSVEEIFGI